MKHRKRIARLFQCRVSFSGFVCVESSVEILITMDAGVSKNLNKKHPPYVLFVWHTDKGNGE